MFGFSHKILTNSESRNFSLNFYTSFAPSKSYGLTGNSSKLIGVKFLRAMDYTCEISYEYY